MKFSSLALPTLGGLLALGAIGGTPSVAKADATSTALIAAGAAAIVGALIYDGNNHPYYVRDDRRYYVTQQEAMYYRGHHGGYMRQSYVPEREYPVARPYRDNNMRDRGNNNMRDRSNNNMMGHDDHH